MQVGKLYIGNNWGLLWNDFIHFRHKWWILLIPKFLDREKVVEFYWLGVLCVWEKNKNA